MYITEKHYSSAKNFLSAKSQLAVSAEDIKRLQAYEAYEDFYHNRPETLELRLQGSNRDPIFLPNAKKIVEATNRFLAVNYNYTIDPGTGDATAIAEVDRYIGNLFRREEVYSKFALNRRYGLIRGDAVWHITADDTKEQGKRISIHTMHPGSYFPIEDPNTPERLLGCHLVDLIPDPREKDDKTKKVVRRQTYRRTQDVNGNLTGEITSEITLWEIGAWDDRNQKESDLKLVSTIKPATPLPPGITSLPVYHVRNNPIPDVVFGSSQIAGIESALNGINQAISDEDFVLIMQGLGMYWTTAGAPQNPDGSPAPWNLGPGQVIEVGSDDTFGRVTGVSSVSPYIEHMSYIDNSAQQGLGIPDIAAGRVDVAVAESGISLKLQLAPIIASNSEKELEILGKMDHMLWDLTHMWMPEYEGIDHPDVMVVSVVDDPMPVNRDQKIQEILLLQQAGLITIAQVQAELAKLGYTFNEGDDVRAVQDAQALALARNGDPFMNRAAEELEDRPVEVPTVGQPAQVAAPSAGVSLNGAAGGA